MIREKFLDGIYRTASSLQVANATAFVYGSAKCDALEKLRADFIREKCESFGAIDVDCCRNVRISNCSVNSPNDDAIVLKSSYALGFARATENVTITNCSVSGYDIGSLLDATYKKNVTEAPDKDGPTGRIKLGTESNGGFRNITISNIVFDHCRGLALETVDGGLLEDHP